MILWYCVLLQKRILFCGQPANAVGACCIATPLLVAPLTGMSRYIRPYVALTDLDAIMRPTYICGTTNLLFETKVGTCLARSLSRSLLLHLSASLMPCIQIGMMRWVASPTERSSTILVSSSRQPIVYL